MDAALQLEDVTKRYGAFTAVDHLSFTAERGKITGFLGHNGAGKTSTLRMALGLIVPTEGRITVLGETDTRKVRDRIGFLPEERGLYRRMTAVEAITFFAQLKGVPARIAKAKAMELLESQGLEAAAKRHISALSKGMAQKVQLLAALAHEPELVILDEPFSGLDPVNQQTLESMIRNLARRGATVVFSTHVMQHAERLCEHVILLARGRKVFDGGVAEARAFAPRALVLEGQIDERKVAALPGVASVITEPVDGGQRVTAALHAGASGQEALRTAFAHGLDVTRFELKEPSLHEAFIVLTGSAA
ncbi:MAG: transporter ATP-binding protein [Caulobacteraceae bacterium]|nr:transporter ATP-binding protein [Caulobacteraceae bacterium]